MTTQTLKLPVILPSGEECDRCIARLQSELTRIKGVSSAAVNNARTTITLRFDPNIVTLSCIETEARQVGAGLANRIDHQTLDLRDLDCPDCASTIEKAVCILPGVLWAGANFASGRIHVEYERGVATIEGITKAIASCGIRACPLTPSPEDANRSADNRTPAWRTALLEHRKTITTSACVLLAISALALSYAGQPKAAVSAYGIGVLVGGWSTASAALMAVRSRAIDMNVLMTLAVIGAAAIGDWFEAATVVALYNIGTMLQALTIERTRKSIRSLMDISPKRALVRRGRGEYEVAVEQVRLHEVVIVKPGERIPMDGEITSGASAINESPITGESMPADKTVGDRVFAGTLNGSGAIELRVVHVYRETVLARIIHRVEEAQAQRAPAQQMIDRFASKYTPAVVGLALAIGLLPPAASWAWAYFHGSSILPEIWSSWFLKGLSLLIIACPCALVISTPVAIVTAIGSASRAGVLIKGGAFLEEIGRVSAILYDKTGTLTDGKFRVEDIVPLDSASCSDILKIAAAIELRSEHPLASAFQDAASRLNGALPMVDKFQSLPGRGARAVLGKSAYHVGGPSILAEIGVSDEKIRPHLDRIQAMGKTAIIVMRDRAPLGIIIVSDTPRKGTAPVIRELESIGIKHQAMVTGDNIHVARDVASSAGLSEFKAGLLPEQKLELVRVYQQLYGSVAMVGDGINDAPALATANVGIVMGAVGSDTAIETADVALMGNDLSRLPYLVRLSRATTKVIRQNVAFSLVTKAVLISAAVYPGLPLWLAVAGDVGVSLIVTTNALRLSRS